MKLTLNRSVDGYITFWFRLVYENTRACAQENKRYVCIRFATDAETERSQIISV